MHVHLAGQLAFVKGKKSLAWGKGKGCAGQASLGDGLQAKNVQKGGAQGDNRHAVEALKLLQAVCCRPVHLPADIVDLRAIPQGGRASTALSFAPGQPFLNLALNTTALTIITHHDSMIYTAV